MNKADIARVICAATCHTSLHVIDSALQGLASSLEPKFPDINFEAMRGQQAPSLALLLADRHGVVNRAMVEVPTGKVYRISGIDIPEVKMINTLTETVREI